MLTQRKTEHPGDAGKKQALRGTVDRRVPLECPGARVTSDAGLLASRELATARGRTNLRGDRSHLIWVRAL